MNVELEIKQINLTSFLEDSLETGKELMTPNVFSLSNPMDFVVFDDSNCDTALDIYNELIEKEKYVYVNFSSNAMANDAELECVDGHSYYYLNEEDAEEYFEEEGIPENFRPYRN